MSLPHGYEYSKEVRIKVSRSLVQQWGNKSFWRKFTRKPTAKNSERNEKILSLWPEFSVRSIGRMLGISHNIVAGVIFRQEDRGQRAKRLGLVK